jgi:hypothetical protein
MIQDTFSPIFSAVDSPLESGTHKQITITQATTIVKRISKISL